MEKRLIEAMTNADPQTLRIMTDSGSAALSGMRGHIDALHSKNAVLLGLSFGVISLVLVFALEFDWLARPEMAILIFLFSILMIGSVISSLTLFWPWKYSDTDFYSDEDICNNLTKTPKSLLEDQVITFKDSLDDCIQQYSRDMKVFRISLMAFVLALLVLCAGLL